MSTDGRLNTRLKLLCITDFGLKLLNSDNFTLMLIENQAKPIKRTSCPSHSWKKRVTHGPAVTMLRGGGDGKGHTAQPQLGTSTLTPAPVPGEDHSLGSAPLGTSRTNPSLAVEGICCLSSELQQCPRSAAHPSLLSGIVCFTSEFAGLLSPPSASTLNASDGFCLAFPLLKLSQVSFLTHKPCR